MLKQIPLFACLDDAAIEQLRKSAVTRNYPKNTVLFSKGDLSDTMYLILQGRVKVVIYNEEGREMLLSILGPGEYFGEMAMLDGQPRSASMVTKTPCRLLIIGREDFKKALFGNTEMMACLLNQILGKLREATDKIESLTFKNVYGRMAALFLQMARSTNGGLALGEKLTHQEIASMVGASREMVSRIMKELVDGGYIAVEKKEIKIQKKLPIDF
jgi:CRP/FNR family cyclic AMP-dependent transcriptional regulator